MGWGLVCVEKAGSASQDFAQAIILPIAAYVGGKLIRDASCKPISPELIFRWERLRGEIRREYKPFYFGNAKLFVNLVGEFRNVYLLDIVNPTDCKEILVFRFNNFRLTYKHLSGKIGQIMFIWPNLVVRELHATFVKISKHILGDVISIEKFMIINPENDVRINPNVTEN